ncbi:hypothetical protein E7Z53_08065 [Kocuria salina]|uniref:hypothetical protein n=1 Tax=Kocuria salina TaxID=1929416 RepID=UPI001593FE6C|nr:hypothetical protein [Kocuria salina]NVC23396.1 hypothetical protein [Kocuria salina]
MADLRVLTKLVDAQAAITAKLTGVLIDQLRSLWSDFDGWYDGELVRTQARASASLVETTQAEVRKQTTAYMRQVYQEMDAIFPEDDIDHEILGFQYARHGVDVEDVYERPVEQYRRARALNVPEGAARARALQRVEKLAQTDMMLTQRDQEHEVIRTPPSPREKRTEQRKPPARRRSEVKGYRRIIHPERSKTGTCGLCAAAASRIYSVEDLMPVHTGCQCTVLPITAAGDPGLTLNEADLNRLYGAAGSTGRQDLSHVRVVIDEHGELGAVMREDGTTELTEDSPRMTAARRASIRKAKETPVRSDPSERIEELERKIAAAEKSIAWADTLDEDVTDRRSRGYWVVSTAKNRIGRYQREIEALSRRTAA